MKKIFALAMAAVMTAGMTTVAFAERGDVTPIIGVGFNGAAMPANDYVFVLNGDGKATSAFDFNDNGVQLEGGDKIAIPLMLWSDNSNAREDIYLPTDTLEWYKISNSADYDKTTYAYADWDVGDADVEVDLINYDLVADDAAYTAAGVNGRIWSVVVTLPENDTNKIADLAGNISVGSTKVKARNADYNFELNLTYAPDATDANIVTKFDGDGTLDVGFTGIVAFEDDLGEIDIEFGEQALFTVDVTGQGKLNLSWKTAHNKEFADMYSYANIDFLTFTGTPSFNRNGYLYIYADEDSFIYEVTAEGAKDVNATWDSDYDAWRIKTRTLTSYAISDVELDEKTVTDDKDDTTTDGGKENPDTGR